MTEPNWHIVARCEEIAPGKMLRVEVGWHTIALANVEGTFYAFDDFCPHMDYYLSDGPLEGCQISCAMHGWTFDIRNGDPCPPLVSPQMDTYPVKIEDGSIQVLIK
ncbi:MAG: non-heme iron oxygenase ferredoxin subunit [Chloroflexota bacterium]|nr:non-heme iron oxygenase ferredoxin subunit [Chloroflexota bacterium]